MSGEPGTGRRRFGQGQDFGLGQSARGRPLQLAKVVDDSE